jgi:hypothetical protein
MYVEENKVTAKKNMVVVIVAIVYNQKPRLILVKIEILLQYNTYMKIKNLKI